MTLLSRNFIQLIETEKPKASKFTAFSDYLLVELIAFTARLLYQ
jgi:hypothetical protein